MLQIGARLARRFTLLVAEPVDVPNLERFVAHDSRLHHDVRVDVVTALAPSAVRQAAAAAARVRDPRLVRVLASGRERVGDESYTYVVTAIPEGLAMSGLIATRLIPPRIAGTIVGDAARALTKASAEGVHHGYLRPSSLTVTEGGRVTVTGLGVDGELAMQAGIGRGATESTDAKSLGRIYLSAITGLDADVATERDLPKDLGVRGRKLCIQVINGSGPANLEALLRLLAPVDTRVLRDFASQVRDMPLLATKRKAAEASLADDAVTTVGIAVAPEVAARADHAQQEILAEQEADPELRVSLAAVDASTGLGAVPPDQALDAAEDPLLAPIVPVVVPRRPPVEPPMGANELHDLYEFDEMVAVQDVNNTTSTWEALLERMHRRWPGSKGLTRRLERAHARANRSGPIKAAPVLIPLFVIGVIAVTYFAWSMLNAPLNPDELPDDGPSNAYPAFTHSPSPLPSPSPSASADAPEGEDE